MSKKLFIVTYYIKWVSTFSTDGSMTSVEIQDFEGLIQNSTTRFEDEAFRPS